MTDEFPTTPAPEPADQPVVDQPAPQPIQAESQSAGEAWAAVVARMGDLGDAVTEWAKAATDSPENRRRLDDVRRGVNDIASKADGAFTSVASSEFGQHVKASAEEAGQAIGSAATKVGEAAAPVVASTFAGIAGFFGSAAQKVEEAASRHTAEAAPPAESAAPSADVPEPPSAPEPPAPPTTEE